MMEYNVHSIFNSISGEVSPFLQGRPTTFIRLYGCNLRCAYCDTPDTQDTQNAETLDREEIIRNVSAYYARTGVLCITGGEPFVQESLIPELYTAFPNTWIETNGTFDIREHQNKTYFVVDYKLDIETGISPWFYSLKPTDFVKFVVTKLDDCHYAHLTQKAMVAGGCRANFAYSPVMGIDDGISPIILMDFLHANPLPNTILNVQIHKYLGIA